MVGAYFFGPDWLQAAIAPANREYGLLESLQVLTLLLAGFLFCGVVLRTSRPTSRLLFGCIFAGVLFLLGEKTDYGLVFLDLWTGEEPESTVPGRNLHNLGMLEPAIKATGYLALFLWFVWAPLRIERRRLGPLAPFRPSRKCLGTVISAVAIGQVAFFLDDRVGGVHGLHRNGHNVSEFHELMIYFVLLVYAYEVHRRHRGMEQTTETNPNSDHSPD
ncbi:MAG: hypothetical protein R3234_08975 [Thermoanaerobaculia bacterium]|nr:hypothetical protein [Thermoanaerobaculia bacterium]